MTRADIPTRWLRRNQLLSPRLGRSKHQRMPMQVRWLWRWRGVVLRACVRPTVSVQRASVRLSVLRRSSFLRVTFRCAGRELGAFVHAPSTRVLGVFFVCRRFSSQLAAAPIQQLLAAAQAALWRYMLVARARYSGAHDKALDIDKLLPPGARSVRKRVGLRMCAGRKPIRCSSRARGCLRPFGRAVESFGDG